MSEPSAPYASGDGAPAAAPAPIPTEPGYYWAMFHDPGDAPEIVEVRDEYGHLALFRVFDDTPGYGGPYAHDSGYLESVARYVGPLTPPSPADGTD